jgi:hypothetical protein
MSLSRRDVLLGLAGVGIAGCTAPPDVPAPVIESIPEPRERLADGPTAQHLLLAESSGMYGGSHLTVYADGLALFYRREMMRDRERRPPVQLLRLGPAELRDLQELLNAPGFVGAAPRYADTKVKDGGMLKLVAGARRIAIHGRAKDVPAEVDAVSRYADALERRISERGQDAFTAAEPRLLVIHDRWHRVAKTSDQLLVWANGALDHRVTRSGAPYVADQDSPDPVVRLEQATPADVAELAALLAGGSFTTAPSISHVEGDWALSGTTHFLLHASPTLTELAPGLDPPAGVRPVLVAQARLFARFDATPNEPNVMPPKP